MTGLSAIRTDVTSLIGSVRRVLEKADRGRLEEAKAALTAAPPELRAGEVRTYKSTYICYASADRVEVLRRVQLLTMSGIIFNTDFLTLDPGERFSRISDQIQTADLFLLFWSSAAANSDWVRREAQIAVDAQKRSPNGLPDIVPVLLGPSAPQPPDFLRITISTTRWVEDICSRSDPLRDRLGVEVAGGP
jgi:soluble cytochrome b562